MFTNVHALTRFVEQEITLYPRGTSALQSLQVKRRQRQPVRMGNLHHFSGQFAVKNYFCRAGRINTRARNTNAEYWRNSRKKVQADN